MFNKILINLPQKINLIVWKKNKTDIIYIYLYNSSKKLNFVIYKKDKFKFDKNTNSIEIKTKSLNNHIDKNINCFVNFLKSWDIYFFSKIKFKGKGFRMRFFKKNKFVKFFFGRSHKTFIFFKKIIMKRINKYKFILKSINKNKIINTSLMVTKIKPVNFYTLRGLRTTRQIIYKRKGKKGTYI